MAARVVGGKIAGPAHDGRQRAPSAFWKAGPLFTSVTAPQPRIPPRIVDAAAVVIAAHLDGDIQLTSRVWKLIIFSAIWDAWSSTAK